MCHSLLASLLLLISCGGAAFCADLDPGPRGHGQTVSYYHLRFKLSSTSDWALMSFPETSELLGWRKLRIRGAPLDARSSLDHIYLVQELAQADAGESMSMTVDWTVPVTATALALTLEKGDIGASTLQILSLEETTAHTVAELSHVGSIAGDDRNTMNATIDLTVLADVPPFVGELGEFAPLVWAFYYPWYSELGDWDSEFLRDRPATPYVSHDLTAIARHVEQAQGAGIDGFISSWWGPETYTDDNLTRLLDVAVVLGFKVSIIFEILDDATGGPRPLAELTDWLRYLLSTHTDHPAYFKVDGRPVVFNWASEALPTPDWAGIFADLRAQGLDAFYVAMGLYGTAQLARFDGLHEYALVAYADSAAAMAEAGRLTRHYHLLHGGAPRLWAATVTPGYDDRLLPDRDPGILVEREDGAYYRAMWDAALATEPDWLLITSWNEWWEHTHIEPSEAFGNLYLDITLEHTGVWQH